MRIKGLKDVNEIWKNLSLGDMEGELWLPAVVYDSKGRFYDYTRFYQVSNYGRVKSLDRIDSRNQRRYEKILKQDEFATYLRANFCDGYSKLRPSVHRVVLCSFTGAPPEKFDANHINAIRTDNRVDNLEWVSRSQNIKHAYNLGTKVASVFKRVRGEDHHLSKGVRQLDLKTGKTINTFGCAREAEEYTGVPKDSIKQCTLGHNKTGYGFKWENLCQ